MHQKCSIVILILALSTLSAQITKESFIGEWGVDKESYLKHLETQMGGEKIDLDDPKLKESRMYSMIVGMVEMADHFSYVFTNNQCSMSSERERKPETMKEVRNINAIDRKESSRTSLHDLEKSKSLFRRNPNT